MENELRDGERIDEEKDRSLTGYGRAIYTLMEQLFWWDFPSDCGGIS